MPRVTFVKAARKDNPAVKKGESYYWWKFRYGGKRYSRTRPRQSQLTQSAYFGTIYSIQEMVEDWTGDTPECVESLVEDVRSEIENLMEETQSSLDNMPEPLQYSPTGELLQERVDALESAMSELDDIDEFEFDEEEYEYEDFDDEGFDSDEERKQAEEEHNIEQNTLCAEHMENEKRRERDEFDDWLDNARSIITDALDSAIV